MTLQERIAALKPLLDNATPRPWVFEEYKGGSRIIVPPDIPINIFRNKANSELICAAVNAASELESDLRELREVVQRVRHKYSLQFRFPDYWRCDDDCPRCALEATG